MSSKSKVKDVTGVVLAGGKSLRYGRNKALVKVDGVSLIEKVLRVMESLFEELTLITNTPDVYAHLGLPMRPDLIKGLGPLGGIHAALSSINSDAGFFVACDMPALSGSLIHHMVMIRDDFDVVVPRISGKIETLHTLYHKRCLPSVKELIDSGGRQVFRFFPKVSVRYVEEEEIRIFDPQLASFYNVNRPEELNRFEKKGVQGIDR